MSVEGGKVIRNQVVWIKERRRSGEGSEGLLRGGS